VPTVTSPDPEDLETAQLLYEAALLTRERKRVKRTPQEVYDCLLFYLRSLPTPESAETTDGTDQATR
jgi:hypothetical protein